MRRWYARLTEFVPVDDHRVDDFYAFFVCCFHLKDWLTTRKESVKVEMEVTTPRGAVEYLVRSIPAEDREAVRDALPVLLPGNFAEAAWRIRQAATRLPFLTCTFASRVLRNAFVTITLWILFGRRTLVGSLGPPDDSPSA
jgi:hypothetical protein